jgi:NNP family nitrate/nitrite transporter-like MFS transporter
MEATVMTLTTEPDTAPAHPEVSSGAKRVLTMSTIAFTLMFAVWLMFGILGVPIQKELGLSDPELAWISAVAVLNGSLWRLPAGILTDRVGGRVVTISMLLLTAIPCFFLTQVSGYGALLVLAFLVGFAGNLFSVGIAWNAAWWPKERQGFALGVFGAGNVGASVTKLLVVLLPTIIASTAGAMYLGIFPGGWRIFPAFYTVALVVVAILTFLIVPRHDKMNGAGKPLGEMLAPLKHVRVWRFSLYYAAVFGAYVALSAWLPKYYVDNFGVELQVAALLTATFIFPASLLRPVGGWFSDKYGARRASTWPTPSASSPSPFSCSSSAAPWGSARPPSTSTSPSTSPTTSAPSAASSGCSAGSADSSCRRCSPTPRSGQASRARRSSSCSC